MMKNLKEKLWKHFSPADQLGPALIRKLEAGTRKREIRQKAERVKRRKRERGNESEMGGFP